MNTMPLPATPNLAAGIGIVLRGLAALIARRFLHDPIRAALIVPLWRHLTRAACRLDRLLARLAAGPLPPSLPRAKAHSGKRRKAIFPTTRAWLIRALGAEAAAYAAQLDSLLADPAAADLLASAAGRRTLAPIRRMLGLLPPRPRRPAAAPPPARSAPRPDPYPQRPTLDPLPLRPRRPWWLPPLRLRSG